MNDDTISRRAAIDRINKQREHLQPGIYPQDKIGDAAYRICAEFIERLPSAQPEREDYTEMKREFIRMASYIDSLLVCPDEQKETLMNFISRLAEFMPWAERD